MSVEIEKSLVQVSELPQATRLSIGLFRLESAISTAAAQRIQIEEYREIIKDALLYDSPFEAEIKIKLADARATLAVMAGGDDKQKIPLNLDDHIDRELDPWKYSKIPSRADTERAKTISREVARSLHPDTSDEVTNQAFNGSEKTRLYDEALKAGEKGDPKKVERILVETKGIFLLGFIEAKLANGMSLDQIATENPSLVQDVETISYIGVKVANDQSIPDKERVERQAASIRARTDVYARSIAYGYCVQILGEALDICGDKGKKPLNVKGDLDVFNTAGQVLIEACENADDKFLGSFSGSRIYQDALDETLRGFAEIVSGLVSTISANETPTKHIQQAVKQATSIASTAASFLANLRREAAIGTAFYNLKESKGFSRYNLEKIIKNNY